MLREDWSFSHFATCSNFFFFLHFLHLHFAKIYGPQKVLQNYTSGTVGDVVWHLTPCPTTVGGAQYCSTSCPLGHGGRGPISFHKFVFFCLNSDGGKLYMKIVAFDKIYNFVVQSFYIWIHHHIQIIDKLSRSQFAVFRSE
jgi:hypothetical protein